MDGKRGFVLCVGPALLCGLPMLLVVLIALAPKYFGRARRTAARRVWQSFLLGLVNYLFFTVVAAVVGSLGFSFLEGIAAFIAVIVLPLMIVIGGAVVTGLVGERVLALLTDQTASPLANLVIGMICMGICALLQVIGWFVLLVLLMIGFGAALLALFRRNGDEPRPEIPSDPEAPEVAAG
jgi:hypothetical protein